MTYMHDLREALSGAQLVVLGTEWREYRELEPASLGDLVADRHVIDARNALDPATWRNAGWSYRALGRPTAESGGRLAATKSTGGGAARVWAITQ
jgi:UDPglucose 6-dehydrogenase